MKLVEVQENTYKKEVYNLVDDINLTVTQLGRVVTQTINCSFEDCTSFRYVADRHEFLASCNTKTAKELLELATQIQDYKAYFSLNGFNPENLFTFCIKDDTVRNNKNEKIPHLFNEVIFQSSFLVYSQLTGLDWNRLKAALSENVNVVDFTVKEDLTSRDEYISFKYHQTDRLETIDLLKYIGINFFDLVEYNAVT